MTFFHDFRGSRKNRKRCTSSCRSLKEPGELTSGCHCRCVAMLVRVVGSGWWWCTRVMGWVGRRRWWCGTPWYWSGCRTVGSYSGLQWGPTVAYSGATVGLQWGYSGLHRVPTVNPEKHRKSSKSRKFPKIHQNSRKSSKFTKIHENSSKSARCRSSKSARCRSEVWANQLVCQSCNKPVSKPVS